MKHVLSVLPLLVLSACGDKEEYGTTAIGKPCDATFTAVLADGAVVDLGTCVNHGFAPLFRHEPTGEVKLRSLSFIFRGGEVDAEDCWVRWDQAGLCDEPYYPFDDATGGLTWSLDDCPGASGAGEGEATAGYANLKDNVIVFPSEDSATMVFKAKIKGGTDGVVTIDGTVEMSGHIDISPTTEDACEGSNGDEDSDGYKDPIYGGNDCDDADTLIHPNAIELCNGRDDDCNGQIDEDLQITYWRDADGDGWGDPDNTTLACDGDDPSGYVDNTQDCDDGDADISPDAVEVCDDVDNDCDGTTDEGCER